MNQITSGRERPRLWPPRALLSARPPEPPAPTLAPHELRRIVAGMIG